MNGREVQPGVWAVAMGDYTDLPESRYPLCETTGPATGTSGHGIKKRSTTMLCRQDGRPLAAVCDECIEEYARAYRMEAAA